MFNSLYATRPSISESMEVRFTTPEAAELTAKAAELGTPVAIYEYVRNNFEYSLYHGARSGSVNSFLAQRGSDVDLAATLIAMLRSQGYPSRYAQGNVSIGSDAVASWVGVKSVVLAKDLLRWAGIQGVALSSDRTTISLEHVWVEVLVPYDNYRGATRSSVSCVTTPSSCRWVSLDPSFKKHYIRDSGLDPYSVLSFDYAAYYDALANNDPARRDRNPLRIYEDQILAWLQINARGKTLEDIPDVMGIVKDESGLLPSSLSYVTAATVQRFNSVTEHDQASVNADGSPRRRWIKYAWVNIGASGPDGTGKTIAYAPVISPEQPLLLLTTQRLTLTSVQTSGNWAMIMRLGAEEVSANGASWEPIHDGAFNVNYRALWGGDFTITLAVDVNPSPDPPSGDQEASNYKDEAPVYDATIGGYYLMAVGDDTSSWARVHRAARQLLDGNQQNPIVCQGASQQPCNYPYVDRNGNGWDSSDPLLANDPTARDALIGGVLEAASSQYSAAFRQSLARLDALNKTRSPVTAVFGVVGTTDSVQYRWDTPFSVQPGGLLINMKAHYNEGDWRIGYDHQDASPTSRLAGHVASSLEHEVWQDLTGFDAVSTVRLIQMARAKGIQTINPRTLAGDPNTRPMLESLAFTSNYSIGDFVLHQYNLFDNQRLADAWANDNPYSAGEDNLDFLNHLRDGPTGARRDRRTWLNDGGRHQRSEACFASDRDAVQSKANDYGWHQTIPFPLHCCSNPDRLSDYCYQDTQEVQVFMNVLKQQYSDYIASWGQAVFDEFDEVKGFGPSNGWLGRQGLGYYSPPLVPVEVVRDLRDRMWYDTDSSGTEVLRDLNTTWVEHLLPAQSIAVRFSTVSPFSASITTTHNIGTDEIVSESFLIFTSAFTANGGYVASGDDLSPALSGSGGDWSPTFNDAVFTDQNTIAASNNNLVKTASTSDPVSVATGNNYHDESDFVIGGRGLSCAFTRTYNSAPSSTQVDGPLGHGWTHSYAMRLKSNDYGPCPNCSPDQAHENGNGKTSSITYTDERGGDHNYIVNETTYQVAAPQGEFDSLSFDSPAVGQHTITFRNGVKYVFEGPSAIKTTPGVTARLKQILDPWGNQLNFGYDGSGRLSTVTDNLGIAGRTGLTLSYDNSGHLSTVQDWSGRIWTYGVNSNGDLTTYTNPLSQTTTYRYFQTTHRLQEIVKPLIRDGKEVKTAFSYYQNGRAMSYANSLGNTESLDYDLFRRTTRVTDPRGGVREYEYDDSGGLVRLVEPDGGVLRFSNNNSAGLRDGKTNALGYFTAFIYDLSTGDVTREQDPKLQFIDTSYGPYGQVASVKDKRGTTRTTTFYTSTFGSCSVKDKANTVTLSALSGVSNVPLAAYCWNSDGTLNYQNEYVVPGRTDRYRRTTVNYESSSHLNVSSIVLTGSDGSTVMRSFTYDNLGRKKTETLPRRTSPTNSALMNLTTTYTYDPLDRVTMVEDAVGNRLETVYDANGQVQRVIGHYKQSDGSYVDRTISTRTYDAADRLYQDTDVYGNTITYGYDEGGNVVAVTDQNNHTTRYEYDAMNRRTAVLDANGNRTETTYDLAGHVVAVKNANGDVLTSQYDELGRLKQVTDAKGFITTHLYDANGNQTLLLDANNQTYVTVYDELDRAVSVSETGGAQQETTLKTYDLLGNITKITDAENRTTTMTYDDLGRLVGITDPLSRTTVVARDEAGNAYRLTNRLGQVTEKTYDAVNRPTLVSYLTDGVTETTTYDAYGNPHTLGNESVTYTLDYDLKNRLKKKTDSRSGKELTFGYDATGNLITKTDYQGDQTVFQYDFTNRLVEMTNRAYLSVRYQYDPAGRLLSRILSDGARTEYTWDPNGWLATMRTVTGNGTLVSDPIYFGRDHVGNVTDETTDYGNTHFNYFPNYRLQNASYQSGGFESWTYDRVGNRQIHNDATAHAYEYYPNSNRLWKVHAGSLSGLVEKIFAYDDEGRLIKKSQLTGEFLIPYGVTVDTSGNLYVSDVTNHSIWKAGPDGVLKLFAGGNGPNGSADGTGSMARFSMPSGVAVDIAGNVYVADYGNSTIRKITPTGVVTTLAGSAGLTGSADGSGSTARFYYPYGVAVDGGGNVYVADTSNNTIRKVTPAGVVTTLAGSAGQSGSADGTGPTARFSRPRGVAVDGSGNVYVADTNNHTIRRVTPGGTVTTLAGAAGLAGTADGTASAARFSSPASLAVAPSGALYVADTNNNTIRKVMPNGVVTTVAGSIFTKGNADGTGAAAQFFGPSTVAVDGSGNVFVADEWNYAIRKVTPGGAVTDAASTFTDLVITWDQKSRAKSMTASGRTTSFRYDPLDYRIGQTGGTLGNRDYYLVGEHLEADYSDGVLQSKYFRGISTDELVAGWTRQNGTLVPGIYHHDQLMSVSGISSHDGQIVQTMEYGAFGNLLWGGATSANRLLYTGRELDTDTQLYYYRARYYDPSVGRFISEDPLGFQAGMNFYAYVGNNPINGNDPSGQDFRVLAGVADGRTAPMWQIVNNLASTNAGREILMAISLPRYDVGIILTNGGGSKFVPDTLSAPPGEGPQVSGRVQIDTSELATSYPLFRDQNGNYFFAQRSAEETLAHELGHALTLDKSESLNLERYVIGRYENPISEELSGLTRVSYVGTSTPQWFGGPAWGEEKGQAIADWLDSRYPGQTRVTQDPRSIFEDDAVSSEAAGGFSPYPNKPNSNAVLRAYAK